jgi:AcrR family transcriptional regulator
MPETQKRRLPAAARRELILEAALADFAANGFDNASMGRIAEASGVGRSALYDHFDSKWELYDALVSAKQEALLGDLKKVITADAPTEERMRATIDTVLAFAERDREGWLILFGSRAPLEENQATEHRRTRRRTNRRIAAMIAPDAERAGLDQRSPSAEAIFAAQQAAINGAIEWWFEHPRAKREEVLEGLVAALWHGVEGLERGASA